MGSEIEAMTSPLVDEISFLSRSPLDKNFKLISLIILLAIVPFPEPGAPIMMNFKNLDIFTNFLIIIPTFWKVYLIEIQQKKFTRSNSVRVQSSILPNQQTKI